MTHGLYAGADQSLAGEDWPVVDSELVMGVSREEHEAAVGVPEMWEAGLGIDVLAAPPGVQMGTGRAVEPVPLEGALGPVPGGVFAGAKGQDLGGAKAPKGVQQVQRGLVAVELESRGRVRSRSLGLGSVLGHSL